MRAFLVLITILLLSIVTHAHAQGISQLQQFTATTSPTSAITQTVYGKAFRLTGQGSGCAQFSANGTLTSTGLSCGTGSGGSSFAYPFPSNATSTQITFNGGLIGALTGNADTATALAANGANCTSGNAPLGVSASGAVESCFDVWTEAENTSAAYISDGNTNWNNIYGFTTFTYPFPTNATSTSIAFNGGLTGVLTGSVVGTATTLAANGSNCSAGSFPLGVDASGASESCTDAWTEAENTSAAYAAQATSITVNGTANQITSSAGAQSLAANRTWTLSFPNLVVFPSNASSTLFSTTYGSSTNQVISNTLAFGGVTGNSWDDFCTAITGGVGLCDGSDASGGSTFSYPFPGNATSTEIAFNDGLLATASTTINARFELPSLSAGGLGVDATGKVFSTATTTFSGGLTYSNGNVTADLGTSITVGELASADFGSWTCNGSTCTIDSGAVSNAMLANSSLTVNGQSISLGSSGTVTAASSTILTDINKFSGLVNLAGGASTTGQITSASASTTNLVASGIPNCDTIDTDGAGRFVCGTDATGGGGGSFAYPFPSDATSTLLTFNGGITLPTTAKLVAPYASTTNITSTLASTTNLIVSGVRSALHLASADGTVSAYAGSSGVCTNQVPTSLSAVGALGSCVSISDSYLTGAVGIAHGGLGAAFTDPNADQLMFWDDSAGSITGIGTLTGASISGTTLTITDSYINSTGDTGTGTYDLGGATAFEIPNGTSPTFSAVGQIGIDTTSGNLLIASSTNNTPVVIGGATTTLYAFQVASTSPDFASGGIIELPAHFLGQVVTGIICKVDGGTSQVINLSNIAGSSDTNAVTCTTTSTQFAVTSNYSFAAYAAPRLEFGTKTGSPDYITIRIIGYRVSD